VAVGWGQDETQKRRDQEPKDQLEEGTGARADVEQNEEDHVEVCGGRCRVPLVPSKSHARRWKIALAHQSCHSA
jgi:hypothetical protein